MMLCYVPWFCDVLYCAIAYWAMARTVIQMCYLIVHYVLVSHLCSVKQCCAITDYSVLLYVFFDLEILLQTADIPLNTMRRDVSPHRVGPHLWCALCLCCLRSAGGRASFACHASGEDVSFSLNSYVWPSSGSRPELHLLQSAIYLCHHLHGLDWTYSTSSHYAE